MKHVQFLRNLQKLQFSGELIRTDARGRRWVFYFIRGSLIHATGGAHPVRQWIRLLRMHCPQKAASQMMWQSELAPLGTESLMLGWEYALLNQWVSRREISFEQANQIIHANVADLLVDIAQAGKTTDQIRQNNALSPLLGLIRMEEVTAKANVRWQAWQAANLSEYSLNSAPIIRQAERLQRFDSAQFYQTLINLLNGDHTLRDLAVWMRQGVVEVMASLVPLIQMGIVELVDIPDLPAPIFQQPSSALSPGVASRNALIACVDDSFLIRHMMEALLTSSGYQFIGIENPVRSLGILIARKPDLIFLDLVMPNTNGHEICQQLRKLSCFRHTPIVILTGSDGFANRLRSNVAGASDFLSKPLDAEAVLNVIQKHLGKTHPIHSSVVASY